MEVIACSLPGKVAGVGENGVWKDRVGAAADGAAGAGIFRDVPTGPAKTVFPDAVHIH